ncbi:cupin domain-containing protein [Shewanella sp. 1_MG-2023]|jgi:quercetin dioxygenase-like cupin family protein|uniref:Cupin domain-containing protein n=1 Tax=Shewanella electrodiphila TaxID=934143 RepID=A0ABT0KS67_9GAMM|nr:MULTISPECIES: cupin domain-containing protein [Shewanella]MCC4831593.1 cupin domain-containing protein [Shewanella sp. 10N.7]MCL1046693.1 cupin domain-containing protein [Shewanella electrodiphila]MDO6611180.1 cupin domain-containing protein [Shewanella sp. 7_MG-2023]MDO6770943.1 cupin domain-containing protein [Shewanella sp. 2_MG-2023]MDO6794670.1 cupin domain-containing protein [Shewanella sp. 1_MG-2023]
MNIFFKADEHPWEEVGEGIKRKIVGFTDDLMVVHLCFGKGAIGTPHTHEIHDQIGYVVKGSFEAQINGEKKILNAGDAFIARKHFEHGVVALEEDSILVDVFSPSREDFLK